MSNYPELPDKYLSLFSSAETSELISIKEKAEACKAVCSNCPDESYINDYISKRIDFLDCQRGYLERYEIALRNYHRVSCTLDHDLQERDRVREAKYAAVDEHQALKKSKGDIYDEINDGFMDGLTMEEAYRAAIPNHLSKGKKMLHPPRSRFRREVFEFYEAQSADKPRAGMVPFTGVVRRRLG